MNRTPTRIGILDWGIGGIDTLVRLRARLPDQALVYWSDSGFTPYGKVPAEALAARICAVARALDVDLLVIACNAASTVIAQLGLSIPVVGVIEPGIALALESGARTIGILGGTRTIDAGLHATALGAAGRKVIALAAQPLSAHVEAGRLDGPELLADLAPLAIALAGADAVLLACTHYPALMPVFARLLPGVRCIDPVERLVDEVVRVVQGPEPTGAATTADGASDSQLVFGTTGDPEATRLAAERAFGFRSGAVAQFRL